MANKLRRRAARRAMSVVTLLAFLQGCSLFDPYAEPNRVYLDRFQGPEPKPGATIPEGTLRSLQAATDYSEALREEYFHAISDQAVLNTTAGLMLIPISAAALYFGIAGPREVLLPLAVAGGATYLGANYLHSQPRELIYASGAGAVTCASAAMSPIRAAIIRLRNTQVADPAQQANFTAQQAGYPTLSPLIVELTAAADSVDALVRDPGLTSAPVQVARERVAAARALANEAAQSDVIIQTAGDTLFSAVQRIRASVTTALIAEEPNLTALASTLSSQLPLRAGQITSQAALQPPAAKTSAAKNDKEKMNTAVSVQQTLDQPLARLAAAQENVRAVVDLAKTGPSEAFLNACGVDVKTAGVNFVVSPTTDVSFSKGDTVESSSFLISGGQSPYDAPWEGLTPDDISAVITYDAGGKGNLLVSEKTAVTKEANYQLRIHDAGNNAVVINVKVGAQTAAKKPAPAPAAVAPVAVAPVPGAQGAVPVVAVPVSEAVFNKELLDMLVVRGCTQPPANLDDSIAVDDALHNGVNALATKFPQLATLGVTDLNTKLKADATLKCN
jgi:hypothetical protein